MGTHDAVNWPLLTWLRMPGFEMTFGVRLDGLSWMLLGLTITVLLLVLAGWQKGTSRGWLWLACLGVLLAQLAGNLGQLFVGWMLSAWASSELARRTSSANSEFRPVWLVQRLSDMALLGGFGLIWMHFGSSLEFSAWTPEAIGALRPELVESIALCLLIGVIGRCAQLPLTVWLETEAGFAAQAGNSMTKLSDEMVGLWNVPDGHAVAERLKSDPANRWHEPGDDSVPAAVLAWWLCASFLPVGIGLLIRLESLFAVASHTRLLMMAVGAFTLLMCSANAAAQNNWPQVLSQIAAGQCGLVFIGMGIDVSFGGAAGLFAFLCQSALIAVLLSANACVRRRVWSPVFVSLLLLASGMCGRHGVADMAWLRLRTMLDVAAENSVDSGHIVLGATESRLLLLVVIILCVSELLIGFALIRAWLLSRREPVAGSATSSDSWLRVSLWLVTLLVMFVGQWIGSDFESWTLWMSPASEAVVPPDSARVGTAAELPRFATGPLVLLSAAGAVLAWWMYSKPSSLPEKVSAAMGPFARLSRNRFYWDDLYFLLVVHPAAVIGEWLVWIDDHVFGRTLRSLRNRMTNFAGESAEPLSRGSAMIGALTTVGSVTVLAWMLLWLRS